MRKIILAAAVASVAVSGLAAPVLASPHEDESFGAFIAGSEVRRNIRHGDQWRNDVLKFHPDGTVTGNYQIRRDQLAHHANEFREGRIYGRWSIEGGALCVFGHGFEYRHKTCYGISKKYGSRREFAATDLRTGEIWQMFIYPERSPYDG